MNQPKVSVVVPIYNVEPYLKECVDSLLAQTLEDIEILLIDDGSPDRCGEIADEYARKDSRSQLSIKRMRGWGQRVILASHMRLVNMLALLIPMTGSIP